MAIDANRQELMPSVIIIAVYMPTPADQKPLIQTLRALAAITIALLIALATFIVWSERHATTTSRLEYYQLYVEIFKSIVIGFGVATFGVLLPATLTEARHRFDRLKESRLEYSETKTGVDYLSVRLCSLSLEQAAAHIQAVHRHKHQADLYDELEIWLVRRFKDYYPEWCDPQVWSEAVYDQLAHAREVLERNADAWDQLSPAVRLERLMVSSEAVDDPDTDTI